MKLWKRKSRLPLLVKELTEQAARRRTYIVRVLYAAALFSCFFLLLRSELGSGNLDPQSVLGRGRELFRVILAIQFGAVLAFLPAMMSGVLTYEKERDSLSLLFLTDLRPWEIILQKYLGRLIPMLTFLLLSLPLTALAYSLGGITLDDLISGGWMVLLTCLQVGAFALMCSAYCRTSLGAFLHSYIGYGLFYLFALFWFEVDHGIILVPLYLLGGNPGTTWSAAIFPESGLIVVSILGFLLDARRCLLRRAFVPPRSGMLQFFRWLDRLYESLNYLVGNIILIKDRNTLPQDRPILWRETTKRSLGKPHYLFRTLLLLEVPSVFIILATSWSSPYAQRDTSASWVLLVLWVIAALTITATAANAVAAERTDQTLEVLLTTPISGRQIILQKMAAIRRLVLVLSAPLLTVVFMEVYLEQRVGGRPRERYLLSSLLAILIYPQMLAWVALWIGMKCAGRMKAILFSLIGLVLWCALPIFLWFLMQAVWDVSEKNPLVYSVYLSPASALTCTEFNDFSVMNPEDITTLIILNYLWFGGILLYFRHRCLKNANRLLGRISRSDRMPRRNGEWWKLRLAFRREGAE